MSEQAAGAAPQIESRAPKRTLREQVAQFGAAMWRLGYHSDGGAIPPPPALERQCHRMWEDLFPYPPRIPETICPVCKSVLERGACPKSGAS